MVMFITAGCQRREIYLRGIERAKKEEKHGVSIACPRVRGVVS